MQQRYGMGELNGTHIREISGGYRETFSCFCLKPIGSRSDTGNRTPDVIWVKSISKEIF